MAQSKESSIMSSGNPNSNSQPANPNRPWLTLAAVIWLQSITGTNSNFPAYSSYLKQRLTISQLQFNNLAFASDAGKLLGWISGLAALYFPLWLVLLAGAFLGFLGYGLQYAFLVGHGAGICYGVVFILTVVAGNSICWINTVCYAAVIGSFPSDSRQVAVGLTTSYQGLSANIYTSIVDAMAPEPSTVVGRGKAYLLLNSILPAAVSMAAAPFLGECITRHPEKVGDHPRHRYGGEFGVLFVITIATGIYAVVSSLATATTGISPVCNTIGMGILLSAPLVIPLIERVRLLWLGRWWADGPQANQIHDIAMSSLGVWADGPDLAIVEAGLDTMKGGEVDDVRDEVGVRVMLRRVEFWLYFFLYLFGQTIGLVYLNNLGQITESRGSSTSSLVSLASAFGFFGRLLPSLLDYLFERHKFALSRPALVAALMAPMTGSFFLLLNPSNLCLYLSTAMIGISTGAISSISVSLTTDLFGTENFSVNHNLVVSNIPIGSLMFGYLSAEIYRREGNHGKCVGSECYSMSFVIWGSLCLVGTILALFLHARIRKFYSRGSSRRS